MGPVTTGTILRETFQVFGRGAGTVLGISLIVHSPIIVLGLAALSTPVAPFVPTLCQLLTGLLVTPIATAAMVFAVFQLQRDEEAEIRESLRVGLSRFWAVLFLSILIGLAAGVAVFLCCFPTFIVQAGLFVAVPALVVERLRVFHAFDRSWWLTDSYKFSTCGVVVLLMLLTWVLSVFLVVMVSIVTPLVAGPDSLEAPPTVTTFGETPGNLWVLGAFTVGQSLFTLLTTTLQATAGTVAYRQLRQTKEGLGEEELLAVFD